MDMFFINWFDIFFSLWFIFFEKELYSIFFFGYRKDDIENNFLNF